MRQHQITRREFVMATAGVGLGVSVVPRQVLGGVGYRAPSERLNVAVVGCGGQGMTDAEELVAGGENIVALADVDFDFVDRNVARRTVDRDGKPNPRGLKLQDAFSKAKRYADFRKMLEERKEIDAVLVATPDHTHAIVAKTAMELGKHVYVEKPLTWSVQEARVLRETAKRTKVVTQMGNQGHSSDEARLINEWIQAGILGPVHEVHVWTNRPIWPQGVPRPAQPMAPPRPGTGGGFGNEWTQRRLSRETAATVLTRTPVPSTLAWDLFLGPAPEVPYHPIYHPFNWRGWVDWGTGALGDMGAHLIDHPYWALGLTWPTTVEATSTPWGTDSENRPVSYPLATQVVYHFPARGHQPPVRLTWYDGGLMAPRPDVLPETVPLDRGGGVLIVGKKGILLHGTYGQTPRLFPEALMEDAKKVRPKYERVATRGPGGTLHRMNWAMACKGQGQASTPFEYASMLTETMLLGVVALKTGPGQQIRYDGATGKILNVAASNQYLEREYRKGWTLL